MRDALAGLELGDAGADVLEDVEAVEDFLDARVVREGGDHRGGVLFRSAGEVVHAGEGSAFWRLGEGEGGGVVTSLLAR